MLFACEYMLTWGGWSIGRSDVRSSVTIVVVVVFFLGGGGVSTVPIAILSIFL